MAEKSSIEILNNSVSALRFFGSQYLHGFHELTLMRQNLLSHVDGITSLVRHASTEIQKFAELSLVIQSSVNESLSTVFEVNESLSRDLSLASKSLASFSNHAGRVFEFSRSVSDFISSNVVVVKNVYDGMQLGITSVRRHVVDIQKFSEVACKSFRKIFNVLRSQEIKDLLQDLQSRDFDLSTFEGNVIEASKYFDEITSKQNSEDELLERVEQTIYSAIQRSKAGDFSVAVLLIIITIVCQWGGDYIKSVVTGCFQTRPAEKRAIVIVRETKIEITNNFPIVDISDLRIVSCNKLMVRESFRKKSRVTDTLFAGSIVKVVGQRKHWRMIEWFDVYRETHLQGWVRAKYLSKLNLRSKGGR